MLVSELRASTNVFTDPLPEEEFSELEAVKSLRARESQAGLGAPLHPEGAPASLVARLAGGRFSTRRPRRFVRSPSALRSGGASASRPVSDSCFSHLSAVVDPDTAVGMPRLLFRQTAAPATPSSWRRCVRCSEPSAPATPPAAAARWTSPTSRSFCTTPSSSSSTLGENSDPRVGYSHRTHCLL